MIEALFSIPGGYATEASAQQKPFFMPGAVGGLDAWGSSSLGCAVSEPLRILEQSRLKVSGSGTGTDAGRVFPWLMSLTIQPALEPSHTGCCRMRLTGGSWLRKGAIEQGSKGHATHFVSAHGARKVGFGTEPT